MLAIGDESGTNATRASSMKRQQPSCSSSCSSSRLPAFSVWQARQLKDRDLVCGIFLLLTYTIHLHKTTPGICSVGPLPFSATPSDAHSAAANTVFVAPGFFSSSSHVAFSTAAAALDSATASQDGQHNWPLAWQLMCYGRVPKHMSHHIHTVTQFVHVLTQPLLEAQATCSSGASNGLSRKLLCGVLQAIVRVGTPFAVAVLYILQMLFTVGACGWLTHELFFIVYVPLRFSLLVLLLLPVPLPNIAAIWQRLQSKLKQKEKSSGSNRAGNSPSNSAGVCNAGGSSSRSSVPGSGSSSGSRRKHRYRPLVTWYHPVWYWQYPRWREAVVLLQRIVPMATALASVGHINAHYFKFGSLPFFPTVPLWLYVGWGASMFVLPFKLHVVVTCIEWILVYGAAVCVNATYLADTSGSSSMMHSALQLLASLALMVGIPNATAAWVHRGLKEKYAAAAATLYPTTLADTVNSTEWKQLKWAYQQGDKQAVELAEQQSLASSDADSTKHAMGVIAGEVNASSSGKSTCAVEHTHARGSSVASSSSTSPAKTVQIKASHGGGSSRQLMSDITSSLHLAASAAARDAAPMGAESPPMQTGCGLAAATALLPLALTGYRSTSNMAIPGLPDIIPALCGLLGDTEASSVFSAAAEAAKTGAVPTQYISRAQITPVGIKLPTASHATLPALAPMLTGLLNECVSAADTVQHAVCFEGCVQLLAGMYSVIAGKPGAIGNGEAVNNDNHSKAAAVLVGRSSGSSSSSSDFAAALAASLGAGYKLLAAVENDNGSASSVASSNELPFQVSVGGVLCRSATATANKQQAVDETGVVESVSAGVSCCAAAQAATHAICTHCDPCCLVAAAAEQQDKQEQQQLLNLYLQGTGSKESSSSSRLQPCRLLVFQQGAIMVDQDVQLDGDEENTCSLSVKVPPVAPGVLHVALFRGSKPRIQQPCGCQHSQPQLSVHDAGAPASAVHDHVTPLLLQPLVVLPAAAATEFRQQCYLMAAAAAAVTDGKDSVMQQTGDPTAVVWQQVGSPVTVDMAFLLSGERRAIDRTTGQLTAAAKDILSHLCRYLMAWQCYKTLVFVVKQVAALQAAAANSASSSSIGWKHFSEQGRLEQVGYELDSKCKPITVAECSASDAAAAAASSCSSAASSAARRVTLKQLLCGFKDACLESGYKVYNFNSTGVNDFTAFAYCAMTMVGCWFASVNRDRHCAGSVAPECIGTVASVKHTMVRWTFSFVAAQVGCSMVPIILLLLRLHVLISVRSLHARHHQQQHWWQQQQPVNSPVAASGSSLAKDRSSAAMAVKQKPQEQLSTAMSAIYAHAADIRQVLLVCWAVLLVFLNISIGLRLVVWPSSYHRLFGGRGASRDIALIIATGIKAAMFQIPFTMLAPLMTLEVAGEIWISYSYGLQPRYWLAVRFVPALLLALAVSAQYNITTRRQFLASMRLLARQQ